MRPRRRKNNQTVPLYEECALWDSLLNAPFFAQRIRWESSAETELSVLQAFNTSTFPEFMARLVCMSWGGGAEGERRGAAGGDEGVWERAMQWCRDQ